MRASCAYIILGTTALAAAVACVATAPPMPAESHRSPEPQVVLEGTVRTAPTCPAQPVASACSAAPLRGATVEAFVGGERAATTVTDSVGHYLLRLPPGRYRLKASNPSLPRLASMKEADVDRDTVIDFVVDSGLRKVVAPD